MAVIVVGAKGWAQLDGDHARIGRPGPRNHTAGHALPRPGQLQVERRGSALVVGDRGHWTGQNPAGHGAHQIEHVAAMPVEATHGVDEIGAVSSTERVCSVSGRAAIALAEQLLDVSLKRARLSVSGRTGHGFLLPLRSDDRDVDDRPASGCSTGTHPSLDGRWFGSPHRQRARDHPAPFTTGPARRPRTSGERSSRQ